MKLSKKILALAPTDRNIGQLRFDARVAYLDGQNARAAALTKQADKLQRQLTATTKVDA